MDIQIGDRVTYKFKDKIRTLVIDGNALLDDFKDVNNNFTIIKIERPKYEVVEEKKELLTEEEKRFLKHYIEIIEDLDNGKFKELLKQEERLIIFLNTGITYYIDLGNKFGKMEINKLYTLKDLGLEE